MTPCPVIGWIGSHTTYPYLENILDVFETLSRNHLFMLKIIGAPKRIILPGVRITQKEWLLKDEIEDFHSIDIGLYPLFDSEWAKGKAAFKALQYMAAGVACVASSVGRNKEVIVHGINGFLVSDKKEWVEKIALLLSAPPLREKMGREGRKTVETHFSVKKYGPVFVRLLSDTIKKP